MSSPEATAPRHVLVARAAVFFVVLGMIWLGPSYRQVFHGKSQLFASWGMFSGAGLGATEVEFLVREADGRLVPIDRYALLVPPGEVPPADLRHIANVAAARRVARALCARLGGDVHVVANMRVATRRGWVSVLDGERDLCVR
jgi:hypothetical protein